MWVGLAAITLPLSSCLPIINKFSNLCMALSLPVLRARLIRSMRASLRSHAGSGGVHTEHPGEGVAPVAMDNS